MQVLINGRIQELTVKPDNDVVLQLMSLPMSELATMHFALRTSQTYMEHLVEGYKKDVGNAHYYSDVALLRDVMKLNKEVQLAIAARH